MAKPAWWSTALLSKQETKTGPVAMLLAHAVESGKTVFSGTGKGILENDEANGPQEFLKAVTDATSGNIVLQGGPVLGRGALETWIVWDSGAVTVEIGLDGKVAVTVATTHEKPYVALGQVISEHLLPEHVRQPVYALTQTQGEIGISEVGTAARALEGGNYDPKVMADFNFITEDLQRREPFGRLVIIEGEPGTGKTYFVRGVIEAVLDAVFILVPSHVVEELAGPRMVPMLLKARGLAGNDKPLVLVIEDADRCLVPRRDKKGDRKVNDKQMAAISSLLQLSDGILGQALDLRVVATTNEAVEEIDEALKRPGRISKHIKISTVSAEQAGEIYTRITEGESVEFEGPHTLAQIYAQAFYDQMELDEEDEDEDDLDDEDEDDDDDYDDEEDEDEDE